MLRKSTVYKTLNIEANEALAVFLLIAQSIFIGIFYGAFDIGAHTLFLKHFPEDMISKAYIVSGLIGIILTAIFSKVQSKINFSSLARYSLLFVSFTTLLMWLFFQFSVGGWTVFLAFILLGPLNIIAILAFWGTVGRMFNLRQGKRLFGIIDTGQILGIIISSFAIPLIIQFMRGTHNLFLICVASIIFALIIEMIIAHRFNLDGTSEKKESEPEHEQVKLKDFIQNPYLRYMALFVAFSMFTAFFVTFSFLVVTNEKYPVEEDLAKYLGFFTGSMMIFTLLIKTFVYSKLLKTYGLRISLLLSSLLILLFTGIAIIVGTFGGFTVETSGFIYFFLLISLSKLFNKTLKDSLEGPSFKLLYQSLNKKIRFDVQAKVDGTVNEISALLSGIFLTGLGLLSFVKLIHFSVALFVILLVWALITFRLYREYRNSLEKALKQETGGQIQKESEKRIETGSEKEKQILSTRKYLPFDYSLLLNQFIKNNKPEILGQCNDRILLSDLYCLMVTNQLPNTWKEYFDKNYILKLNQEYSAKELTNLLLCENLDANFTAIKYISECEIQQQLTLLSSLLRSHYIVVQKTAITLCGWLKINETLSMVAEFIGSEALFSDCIITLSILGKKHPAQLIQLFYKSDITLNTQQALLEILGSDKNETSIKFLIDNLSYHRTEIVYQSVKLLRKIGYQASDSEKQRFFHPITQAAQTLSWDIAAIVSVKNHIDESPMLNALEDEHQRHIEHLFNLLSITYNSQSVQHVKDYLDSGSAEGASYALELFDLFISEEIKPVIIPIFEEVSDDEKILLLQNHFPIEVTSLKELVLNTLNRDVNYISIFTKKIALSEYPKYFDEINDTLIAQLFSPVAELQVLAAKIAQQIDAIKFNKIISRIEIRQRKQIEAFIHLPVEQQELIKPDNQAINLWKSKTGLLKESSIGFSECIDMGLINYDNSDDFNAFLNKYFVFLELDSSILSQINEQTAGNLYIDNQLVFSEIGKLDKKVFLGINKKHVGRLCINNKDLLTNLLNQLK
jgi:ATP:ADP antiporter, AAA family